MENDIFSWQVVAVSDLGLGTSENAGAITSGGKATALTLADGVLVDLSIVGAHCLRGSGSYFQRSESGSGG